MTVEQSNADKSLREAILNGAADEVKKAIADGANVDGAWPISDRSSIPLHLAGMQDDLTIDELLLEAGADVDRSMPDRGTPFYFAVMGGNLTRAELLRRHGAAINSICVSHANRSLLHALAETGQVNAARFLVAKGANVRVQCNYRSTPLHSAAERGNIATAKFLLHNGADIDHKDWRGSSPLFYAERANQYDMQTFLTLAREVLTASNDKSRFFDFRSKYLPQLGSGRVGLKSDAFSRADENSPSYLGAVLIEACHLAVLLSQGDRTLCDRFFSSLIKSDISKVESGTKFSWRIYAKAVVSLSDTIDDFRDIITEVAEALVLGAIYTTYKLNARIWMSWSSARIP